MSMLHGNRLMIDVKSDAMIIASKKDFSHFFTLHYWNELHPNHGVCRPLRTASFAADYFFWGLIPRHFDWPDKITFYSKTLAILDCFSFEARCVIETLNNLGVALYVTGRLDDALVYFQKALKISPDDVRANMNTGKILAEKGRFEEALILFSKILDINPDHRQARREYAFCVRAIEQRLGAIGGYDRP